MSGFQFAFIASIGFIGIAFIKRKKTTEKVLVEGFKTKRECVISGESIIYRVEINNKFPFVIKNVIIALMAYPKNCMEFAGQEKKTIKMIGPGKSRMLEFRFSPTKDRIGGQIHACASYMDPSDELHAVRLEPLDFRFVCDLLNPTEMPVQQYDILLSRMDAISDKVNIEIQAEILFERAKTVLPARNFYIIDTEKHVKDGLFTGAIRSYAEGKYANNRIAVLFLITGALNNDQTVVKVQAHGDDLAMLPTAVNEIVSELREVQKIPTSRQLIRYQEKI